MSQAIPKKSLGQHWLNDQASLEAIVDAADILAGDIVLEIGPGQGVLTDELLKRGAKVQALEFDQDLIPLLRSKYSTNDNVQITEGDIRTFDFRQMPSNFKIVANIPYYLTSNLVRLLADTENKPELSVLLVQKEVAERICAKPGKMGMLSVAAQWYFDCSLGVLVDAAKFTPPPKVDSQVVLMKRKHNIPEIDDKKFWRIVKAGFSEKRKTLSNSLSGGLALDKQRTNEWLDKAGVDSGSRAQMLTLEDWFRLYSEQEAL
ncbi:MAG: 16S rRNA (adenine(1518)-N(6)/adenine(1519)-N(6))-dimethyltransferase RsmA [bacterium]|nr:16S rRNA (adenine(1518)-N(6)/adenine(1519)-N(6))-dimethyltransferase RsmA [bacterium]